MACGDVMFIPSFCEIPLREGDVHIINLSVPNESKLMMKPQLVHLSTKLYFWVTSQNFAPKVCLWLLTYKLCSIRNFAVYSWSICMQNYLFILFPSEIRRNVEITRSQSCATFYKRKNLNRCWNDDDDHHHQLLLIRPYSLLQFRITSEIMNHFRHLVELLGRIISPSQGQHNTERRGQTSMPWARCWNDIFRITISTR
jgi:hypothetical protein